MPSSSPRATFATLSPPIRSRSSPRESVAPASEGEVEQDELVFTIESPSQPQLQLFENVFNTGKSLASYCHDDPLWSTLAEVALPCSNCVRHPKACKVNSSAIVILPVAVVGTSHIAEDAWRRYDSRLHSQVSSTSTLLELTMLDDQDTRADERQELESFQRTQEQEAASAAKCKLAHASPPRDGSTKKRRVTKTKSHPGTSEVAAGEVPRIVRLVIPPARPAPSSSSLSSLPLSSLPLVLAPGMSPVSRQTGSVRDPEPLVHLAEVAGRHTGFGTRNADRFAVPVPPLIRSPQKDTNASPSSMPPANRPPLVPQILAQHPYHAENERLVAQVHLLQLQLASSRQENSTLASALRDTSISLEAHQGELEQLRASASLSSQWQEEYDRLMDQLQALQRLLPGPVDKPLVDRFQAFEENYRVAREDRDRYLSHSASSERRNKELERSLIQQQSLVDESNVLAVCQRKRIEAFQEEVHCFRERALFVEKMVREYPEEGPYSVSLPPLAEVQGQLNDTLTALRSVATFAHRLYRSNPATVLHQHNRYMGTIIEAIISFLRRGLDTAEPDIIVRSFQLALEFMEAARGVHAELHLRSLSSIQWFFHNTAEREEGTYRLILANSRFPDDSPFLNAAQHAGFLAPFEDSLEPPLHHRMFALETALPHHGLGNWEDLVPAVPSLDQATQEWEAMMLDLIHFVMDTPPPGFVSYQEVGVDPRGVDSPPPDVPLFLPDSMSPASPLLPNPSPPPPPLFGAITTLAIDLTSEDDDKDLYESPSSRDRHSPREVTGGGMEVDESAPIRSESPVV
ncbi:hypothetical protein F5876DRAFT_83446 [Lentinula aff. lateritia]|uniref:Uncharacterized protein n=1 Tax=Lentinula aff. lateritia TaxID=2804960 RepID=A0ACC1THX7_9AGAR|nr:hypothetical protein F5876DRAFT_83446 [Lentinula aff. lateritia]